MKRDSASHGKLMRQVESWGMKLSQRSASRLGDYAAFLKSYEGSNVIGAKSEEAIFEDHVVDSLSCLLFGPLKEATSLVDVGSGAGLPGLPIGLVHDEMEVLLVESTTKKTNFLLEAVNELSVKNARILNERAEIAGRHDEFRGRFDVATARAVSSLDVLAEYCLPLVKVGGHVIAMKGRIQDEERKSGESAAELLGGELAEIIEVTRLAEYEQKHRNLIVLKKVAETPRKYPRKVGMPAKKPLGENRKP